MSAAAHGGQAAVRFLGGEGDMGEECHGIQELRVRTIACCVLDAVSTLARRLPHLTFVQNGLNWQSLAMFVAALMYTH